MLSESRRVAVAVIMLWPSDGTDVGVTVNAESVELIDGIVETTAICCLVLFPEPSVAITVMLFAPELSETVALQFAVAVAEAVPPLLATPLTVTDEIPLLPFPLSVAVPLTSRLDLLQA